jgi:hypothetical protein
MTLQEAKQSALTLIEGGAEQIGISNDLAGFQTTVFSKEKAAEQFDKLIKLDAERNNETTLIHKEFCDFYKMPTFEIYGGKANDSMHREFARYGCD